MSVDILNIVTKIIECITSKLLVEGQKGRTDEKINPIKFKKKWKTAQKKKGKKQWYHKMIN